MADVLLSDVHLRLDHPKRGERLARVVDSLAPSDRLTIVGDLCDFWFASRQYRADPRLCAGLRSLLDFRARGGSLTLMLGNHDAWLGSYYQQLFEIEVTPEPFRFESHGLRLHLAHGHRVKSKMWWKHLMEGRLFIEMFRRLPGPLAHPLQAMLEHVNERTRERAEVRMIDEFWEYARELSDPTDLVVFGHVHRVHDSGHATNPRLIVLGDWTERTNYLRIDDLGIQHASLPDGATDLIQSTPLKSSHS